MPLSHLRNVRIETVDQEKVVQEIVNLRMATQPPLGQIYRGDIPFKITTVEEEKKWQKIIDQRTQELKDKYSKAGMTEEELVQQELNKLEAQKIELEKPIEKAICLFCDTKSKMRHKKVCTRP